MSNIDYKIINTDGTTLGMVNGKMSIILDEKITRRAFEQVLEYLYTDRVSWDKDTDIDLIKETQEAAKYLQLDRLDAITETFLDKNTSIIIPESSWWSNMKWAFENLRGGKWDLSDLTLVCKEEDGRIAEIKCHAVVMTSACKYFHSMLAGDTDNEQKRTMRIDIDDLSEKQMTAILKYIYTREFEVDVDDVIGVWMVAHKMLMEDLQVECESVIMKNVTKENVDEIKKIAEMIGSFRLIPLCESIQENTKK